MRTHRARAAALAAAALLTTAPALAAGPACAQPAARKGTPGGLAVVPRGPDQFDVVWNDAGMRLRSVGWSRAAGWAPATTTGRSAEGANVVLHGGPEALTLLRAVEGSLVESRWQAATGWRHDVVVAGAGVARTMAPTGTMTAVTHATGEVDAVWVDQQGGVRAARRAAAGTWAAPVQVAPAQSSGVGPDQMGVAAGAGPAGRTDVYWRGASGDVQTSARTGDAWSAPAALPLGGTTGGLAVVQAGARRTLLFSAADSQRAAEYADGGWSAPVRLGPAARGSGVPRAVGVGDRLEAYWAGSTTVETVRGAGDRWSAVAPVPGTGVLAAHSGRQAVVPWVHGDRLELFYIDQNSRLATVGRTGDGPWSAPTVIGSVA
ncbi:hypothetical protein GCM10010124_19560 [Pilimelia terevasa]|uniref:Uncharacterized protein n=1 Tax=Pilimelia terevasa TaxID=53372 RepID=A0A8J3FH16_9ACTN|nr:hypothetical protein [Pilimelia terevasa]GGK26984.1 hypothetical protein GCM10010124_19560 [Pilimelia terevasa]